MIYVNAFLFAGFVCLIGQIILDNTKLTPGHVTSIFVVTGALLDTFSIYDKFGFMGLAMGMFDLTASGIISAIIISFFLSLIFNPRD